MYHVYSKFLKNGKEQFIKSFDNAEDAIRHIARCYRVDDNLYQLGEYYYWMIKR